MAKQRLRHLKNLRFRRERGSESEQPLFTNGRLNLYGFNRIFSAITQFVATREFNLLPSQSCFYYSEWGEELINRYSGSRHKARSNGGQFEYCVDIDGKHQGHWRWQHSVDLGYLNPEQRHWAMHVVTGYKGQIIDFQSPAFLNYRVNKGYGTFITPIMYNKSITRRFKDWRIPRDGLTAYCAWKPTNYREFWLKAETFDDILHYSDRIVDLFEQRIVCRELERFHGMDELDYTKRESYIWTDDQ